MREQAARMEGTMPDSPREVEDISAGYKRTAIGMIPEDWEVSTLGALGEFKNGINKDKQDFGHGFPFVNLMDVFGIPKVSTNSRIGLVNSSLGEREAYALQRGDVLFVRSSVKPEGVGLTTLILEDLPNTVFSGFLIRYRAKGALEFEFKEHCFHEASFRNRLIASSTVSANTNINQESLKSLILSFPPNKSEQLAIATLLSDVDELIGSLEAVIVKKRAIKQAAMQELLTGRTRLPGFGGEWGTVALGTLLSVRHGRDHRGSITRHGRYPVLGSGGVMGRTNRILFDRPSVLIGRKGTINKPRFMSEPFWTVDTMFYTDISPSADPNFLYYLFCQIDWLAFNEASGLPSLNAGTIESILVSVPAFSEQQAIATVLSDMDSEVAALEQRLDKTRAIKQGMMQQLLTGSIRLPIPDADTEDAAHDA